MRSASTTRSTSASVVPGPIENRSEPCACAGVSPMAVSTCEGVRVPEAHAEPEETRKPLPEQDW